MLRHADGVKGQAASGANRKGESTEAQGGGGAARSGVEGSVMGLERRGCVVQPWPWANRKREEPVDEAKPFKIPKREVWEAFKRVKANQGAAGVDGQSIAEFEANLSGNLHCEPRNWWLGRDQPTGRPRGTGRAARGGVGQRPRQPIDFVDKDHVDPAGPDVLQEPLQGRPVGIAA